MKIVKTVLICAMVAVPVGFGAFYYGRTMDSHPQTEAVHGEEALAAGPLKSRGNSEKAHETEHGEDAHEDEVHGEGAPKESHAHEDHVPMTQEQIRTLGIGVAEAGPGNLEMVMDLPGEIILNDDTQALVTPYVSGYVTEIRKRQGDRVRKGEVMAVLRSRELADAGTQYLAARERLALAEKTFQREESLWRKKISPETDYLESRMALSSARIAVRSARQKLLALGLKKTAIDGLSGQGNGSLTRYEIVSPLDGLVLEKHLSLGEMVESTAPVYRVANMGTVWVKINLHQKYLPYLKMGMPVGIRGDEALPGATGTLTFIGPLVGRETRTADGRATLSNPDGRWRPGLFVTARIETEKRAVSLLVPKDAVQHMGDKSVVFVPAGKGFEARVVTMGASDERFVEIISGLSQGDRYVRDGAFELKATLMTEALGSHAGHGH